jgi:multiple sugar transport system permease protein
VATTGLKSALESSRHTVAARRRKPRRYTTKDAIWGYLMIAPLMLGLFVFYLWPVCQTFYFSFTEWGAFGKYHWSGLSNYQQLFSDPQLLEALRNTLIFTVISVPVGIMVSILVAVLLNQKIRGVGIYRTLYFLPAVTMPAAIALVWKWLYNGDFGLINYLLSLVHIQGPRWVSDPHLALYSLTLVAIWSSIGNTMVLFLAGLQGIPATYYEAASLDGANASQRFWRITLPLLSPTIFFASVIALIQAFQVFDLIFLMFGTTSGVTTNLAIESTQTVVYLFYKNAFILGDKGYAAAISMLLFVIILCVTAIQFRLQRRWVHYS